MKNLSPDKVIVKLRKTPLLFSRKSLYRLSDFCYGEWILFEHGVPRFYLYAFDEIYSKVIHKLKSDGEKYLKNQFKEKGLNLSTKEVGFGIPLPSKSEIVELSLEKLPLDYIS